MVNNNSNAGFPDTSKLFQGFYKGKKLKNVDIENNIDRK